jgi:hypothetical protein
MEGLGRTSQSQLRSRIDAKPAAALQGRPATNRVQREEHAIGFSSVPQLEKPPGDTHEEHEQNEYPVGVEMRSQAEKLKKPQEYGHSECRSDAPEHRLNLNIAQKLVLLISKVQAKSNDESD